MPNAGEVRVCTTTADDLDDFPRTHKRREGAMSHGDADKPAGSKTSSPRSPM